jgi:hypothetical protein
MKAAKALLALVEVEEHARLLVSTGSHAAQPVADLLKGGNLEEKVVAAEILARVSKVNLSPLLPFRADSKEDSPRDSAPLSILYRQKRMLS